MHTTHRPWDVCLSAEDHPLFPLRSSLPCTLVLSHQSLSGPAQQHSLGLRTTCLGSRRRGEGVGLPCVGPQAPIPLPGCP